MITEAFLNSCYRIILCKEGHIKKDQVTYRDILNVLKYYDNQKEIEVPVNVQAKFDCLKKITEMLLESKTIENAIDSVSFSKKFADLQDFISLKREETLTFKEAEDIVKQIRLRKKLNSLLPNYDQLTKFIESLKDGTFESIDDVVLDYEAMVKNLYTKMMTENRGVSIESSSSLDLVQDDYSHVLELIRKKYERVNATPTGFTLFDNEILKGGFEPSRLYIFGGASGSGKSTLLNNFIIRGATKDLTLIDNEKVTEAKKDGVNRVFIYITLENTIEESLLRTYQPMFTKSQNQVLAQIANGENIRQMILDQIKKSGSTIIMKYFPAMSISALDIMAVVDDAINEYGSESIKGLYVDYLDLLRTDTKYDIYRLELGHITLSLKTLAVEYNIPVIVPTQLGRSAYRVQETRDLNLDQISEAIKKVEHADFVALMSKDPNDETKVHCRIGKNRSGKNNININFKVDFNTFRFINAIKVTNDSKKDVTSEQKIPFTGLGETF